MFGILKRAGRFLLGGARKVIGKTKDTIRGIRHLATRVGEKVKNIPIVGGMAYGAGKKLLNAPIPMLGGMSVKGAFENAEDAVGEADKIVKGDLGAVSRVAGRMGVKRAVKKWAGH